MSAALGRITEDVLDASDGIQFELATAPIVSDSEARVIWERAARLQADTGIIPRSAAVAGERDANLDAARTSGYKLGDVRAAAIEAGISSPYVEHALVEHGLAPSKSVSKIAATRSSGIAGKPAALTDRSTGGKWIGAPTMLEFEAVIDGEVSSHDFDLFGEAIQRTVGENGTLSSVGRSLAWHNKDGESPGHRAVAGRGRRRSARPRA